MRNVFESLSYNVGAAIDGPYQLKTVEGSNGFRVTLLAKTGAKKRESQITTTERSLKLTPD